MRFVIFTCSTFLKTAVGAFAAVANSSSLVPLTLSTSQRWKGALAGALVFGAGHGVQFIVPQVVEGQVCEFAAARR